MIIHPKEELLVNADTQLEPITSRSLIRRIIFAVAKPLVIFLLGFVPMSYKSRQYARRLAEAERQLNMERIYHALLSAIIDVQQGNYELARQDASTFFTFLRKETDMGNDAALSLAQKEGVQQLFVQRDEIITLLAQSNPAAVGRLTDLYGLYREIINR